MGACAMASIISANEFIPFESPLDWFYRAIEPRLFPCKRSVPQRWDSFIVYPAGRCDNVTHGLRTHRITLRPHEKSKSAPTHRRPPVSKGPIHNRRNPQRRLILKGPRDDLHADGQALRRLSHWHNRRRRSERVEPLRVPPGIEIFDRTPVNFPAPLAVAKRRNAGDRAEQQRVSTHLFKRPCAEKIVLGPRIQEIGACQRGRTRGNPQKLIENWAQLAFSSANLRRIEHCPALDEKLV